MARTTLDAARIREIYDTLAPRYDRREALLEWAVFRRFRRDLLAWASGDVLEIGIGTGRSLPYYPPDCHITGIDLSPAMLEVAERRRGKLGREVDLRTMDAHELEFPSDRFDTVVSNLTTCTFIDPVQALAEMARVAKPRGRVLLLEHGRSPHRPLSWLQDRWAPWAIQRQGCHPNRNMVALAQAAGLIVLKTDFYLAGLIQIIRARPPHPTRVTR